MSNNINLNGGLQPPTNSLPAKTKAEAETFSAEVSLSTSSSKGNGVIGKVPQKKEAQQNEAKKTKETASSLLSSETIYPTKAKLPEIGTETINIESFHTKQDLDANDANFMGKVRACVREELAQRGQKPNKTLIDLRKPILTPPQKKEDSYAHTIKSRCALYYAWTELEASPGLGETEKVFIETQKNACKETIAKVAFKGKNAKKEVEVLTFKADGAIAWNNPRKFICGASQYAESTKSKTTEKPKSTYPKVKVEQRAQKWTALTPQLGKQLKRSIKAKINEKVANHMKSKYTQYGSDSLAYHIALNDYATLLKQLEEAGDDYNKVFEILNETIATNDGYCKGTGVLFKDEGMQFRYKIAVHSATDEDKSKFYAELNLPNGTKIPFLYHYTEEYFRKNNKNWKGTAIPHEVNAQVTVLLKAYLKNVCKYLEERANELQSQKDKKSVDLSNKNIDQIIESITNYFKGLIKLHKNLSHNRFVDLFAIHTSFVNRLGYALSKLEPSQKDVFQKVVSQILNPAVTLLNTKRHRTTQGCHYGDKEEIKKHEHIRDMTSYVKYLTAADSFDMCAYECSHVVPFPALFARREKDFEGGAIKRGSKFVSASITTEYLCSPLDKHDAMCKKDIDILFEEYKQHPEEYVDNVLELLMKVSLEESSHTIHMPSMLNQETDAVAEKYITPSETIHPMEVDMLKKFQKMNDAKAATQNSNATSNNNNISSLEDKDKYTLKFYKYILGIKLFELIQEQMNGSGKAEELDEVTVIEREKAYIHSVKLSIAAKIEQLTNRKKTISNLILAYTMCNVFYGIKNMEALHKLDFTDGEEQVEKSFRLLEAWVQSSRE